ncbi:hypothetical protein CYMTET_23535 [Cymbomonas tetramitiformis]|uniref:Uncharacterized protein n=1 Tax=Cymbomonas tetramitiformis TaxID=36881 RepID=A0AAE0FXZ8_9CHLO|nr:hypothetical protein CYMTET_23535 [Cymbomonas tetramitiformis]
MPHTPRKLEPVQSPMISEDALHSLLEEKLLAFTAEYEKAKEDFEYKIWKGMDDLRKSLKDALRDPALSDSGSRPTTAQSSVEERAPSTDVNSTGIERSVRLESITPPLLCDETREEPTEVDVRAQRNRKTYAGGLQLLLPIRGAHLSFIPFSIAAVEIVL